MGTLLFHFTVFLLQFINFNTYICKHLLTLKSYSIEVMKKQHLFLWIFLSILMLVSCTDNKKTTNQPAELPPVSVDELLSIAEQETNNQVVVEGICTHICSHGGKKIFLMGSDDSKTIRVESTNNLGAFKPECVNSQVTVVGQLKEERIDEAYLTKWENEMAAGTAEEHGEDGEGCETEKIAQGQENVNSEVDRIKDFRTKIAERNTNDGKNYLSFYYIEATEYSIL